MIQNEKKKKNDIYEKKRSAKKNAQEQLTKSYEYVVLDQLKTNHIKQIEIKLYLSSFRRYTKTKERLSY